MEGQVTISVETFNRLRDENKRLKEENAAVKKKVSDLVEDGRKVIVITHTDRYFYEGGSAFSILTCKRKEHEESIRLVNYEEAQQYVEKVKNLETFKEVIKQLEAELGRLKKRGLWQRITNKGV